MSDNPLLDLWVDLIGAPVAVELARRAEAGEEFHSYLGDNFGVLMSLDRDETVPVEERRWVKATEGRTEACSRWSWAVPSSEAIERLAQLGPIVDVCAGTGYWARLLASAGAQVYAYDLDPPLLREGQAPQTGRPRSMDEAEQATGNHWHRYGELFFPVERADAAKAAARHPEATLLLVWPPYNHDVAYRAAKAHLEAGGRRLAYVGEGAGGCTADDDFHSLLGEAPFCSACYIEEHEPAAPEREYLEDHRCSPEIRPAYLEVDHLALPQWPGIHDELWVYEAP